MTTADRIKLRREALGLTQAELAEKMGFKGKSSISKIEASENKVTLKTVKKAALALGCRPAYLMGWTEDPVDGPFIESLQEEYGAHINDFERLQFNSTITDHERSLLVAFRNADHDEKRIVEYVLRIKEKTDGNS